MPAKNNQQVIKDALNTTDLKNGGYLSPKQAALFIRMVQNETSLLKATRVINMSTPEMEIDKIGVGKRLMRGAAEAEDMSLHGKKPVFGKFTLSAQKYSLPFELTDESLEDNIEGKKLGNIIFELFAQQAALDTEDLMLNGDRVYESTQPSTTVNMGSGLPLGADEIIVADITAFPVTSEAGYIKIGDELMTYESVDTENNTFKGVTRGVDGTTAVAHANGATVTWVRDALMGTQNGILKLAKTQGGNYLDGAGANISKDVFFDLERLLPKRYRTGASKARLRWFVSSRQYSLWREYLTDRATSAGDSVLAGGELKPLGIPMMEIASMPEDSIMLTDPKNIILGLHRKMRLRSTDSDKEAVMREVTFYNMSTRMALAIEEAEAIAFTTGLNKQEA